MRRSSATAGIVVLAGLFVSGCTLGPQDAGPTTEVADDADAPADVRGPDADAGATDGATDGHDTDAGGAEGSDSGATDHDADPSTTVVCDTSVVSAIDATVAGQLDAFAAGDYEAALGFASRAFRAGTDATAFRRLIANNYATLTDDATHRSGVCQQAEAGGIALILIQVTGADGTREDHVYVMVQEDDRWLIQGVGAPDGPDRLVA